MIDKLMHLFWSYASYGSWYVFLSSLNTDNYDDNDNHTLDIVPFLSR